MNKRPTCQIPKCNGEGLIVFSGMIVCGECMTKFYYQEQKQLKEKMLNINRGD